MRKVLIGLGVVIVLVVAAAFVVPMFIPTDTYKAEIKERVLAQTGREIDIKGDLKFSILPTLALKVDDVAFANAPGASTKQMATFKQLVVKLKAIPLISGDIEIDEFQLVEPVINPVWAWWLHGERPAGLAMAGGALILGATVVSLLTGRRRRAD